MAEIIGEILQLVVLIPRCEKKSTFPPPSLHWILAVRIRELSLWVGGLTHSL